MLDRLMVEVADDPCAMLSEAGFALIAKSGDGDFVTVTETRAE
jgi:hypothetical protein